MAPEVSTKPLERRHYVRLIWSASLLIALLVTAVIVASVVFLPIHRIDLAKSETAPFQAGIDTLKLDFSADVAQINVTFENQPDTLVVLNVSAVGAVGILALPDPVRISFNDTFIGHTLTVSSQVYRDGDWKWYPGLKVACVLHINPSLNMTLNIKTTIGEIVMNTKTAVTFDSMTLEATAGAIDASLAQGVIINGDVSIRTTTGGINFTWDNLKAAGNIQIDVRTTTGGLDVNAKQTTKLPGNVTLSAEVTTGGIVFAISITDGIAARIQSNTAIGGITADKIGFSGNKSPLQSDSYPSSCNIIADLRTSTGGIYVNATYNP